MQNKNFVLNSALFSSFLSVAYDFFHKEVENATLSNLDINNIGLNAFLWFIVLGVPYSCNTVATVQ